MAKKTKKTLAETTAALHEAAIELTNTAGKHKPEDHVDILDVLSAASRSLTAVQQTLDHLQLQIQKQLSQ